jgi:hypothetical protein
MKNLKSILAICVLSVLIASCTKDGETGPQGPAGTSGTNGTNGNANVSDTTFIINTWTTGTSFYYVNLDYSQLTSTVQEGGAVQVYFSSNSGSAWYSLTWIYDASTDYYMSFYTQTGRVVVKWQYDGSGIGSDPTSIFTASSFLKVVVIPPAMRIANLDLTNYQAVKSAYNLKD